MHEVVRRAREAGCKGAVLDVDGTMCLHNFAKSIGYGVLKREASYGNVSNVFQGLYGVAKVKVSALKNGGEEDARSLKISFQAMGKTRCVTRKLAYRLAEDHRRRREIEGIGEIIRDIRSNLGPCFASSLGCNIGADVVMEAYNLDGRVSNPMVYEVGSVPFVESPFAYRDEPVPEVLNDNSIIIGCDVQMKGPRDKKEFTQKLLKRNNLDLRDMLAIVDKHSIDSDIIDACLFPASSPDADEKTQNDVQYIIKSYVC
ncbi:MAG: hypothetical protein V1678_03175 [Candidatus Aenigmatarchaeota archaeon]